MRYTFACIACGVVLDDDVDYTWCPTCGGEVKKIEAAVQPAAELPTIGRMTRGLLVAFALLQAGFAVIWPDAFPYLAMWLLVAQLVGVAVVLAIIVLTPAIRDLVRDKRTRVLHGLEHATINLMLERDFPVYAGQTYAGEFVIELVHDGRSWNRLVEIRNLAREAIIRVARGERELAYSDRCGTSWLVGYCVLALAIVACGILARVFHVPAGYAFAGTVAAGFVVRALERPLGLWAQRWLTVSTDLLVASIKEMERSVSPDGSKMIVTIAMDVTPKTRVKRGGTVIPLFG